MKEKKTRQKRRSYDAEFKKNALQMVANGRSVSEVCKALGIKEGLLYTWKSKAKKISTTTNKTEVDRIKELEKKLQQVEQERDILKKALSIFSRQS